MAETPIQLTIAGPRATIRLDRPSRNNAINGLFCAQFEAAAAAIVNDTMIKVAVIEASGDCFSVGGDLKEFLTLGEDPEAAVLQTATALHRGILLLSQSSVVSIAVVQGVAAGAGLSLVCAADLAVGARAARLTAAYTRVGLTPDGGLSYFLPRIVGMRRAFELMSLNPVLTAEDAFSLGLLSKVVEDGLLAETVEGMVASLLATPGTALPRLKALLQASRQAVLGEQLALEAEEIARSVGSEEARAAMRAFFQSRSSYMADLSLPR
ncbi:2-(1,2-epoxy-1,2-dihydrophenyl)acetyl-CoA isomerase [Rhodoligotrophos appendicifer]|uniref:enoyl-CoA hydratase/isomerase family protein n=1 Tax=Rhodoligotrophos appendicifer TaxID=987056 RepID=UPI001185A3BA|nr:enoyl-CoA hydratase-related protein [Rhodoligotrophos appendicifer]